MDRLKYLFFLCFPVIIYGFRLPKNVLPSQYTLQIIPNLEDPDNFDFYGKVVIQITCYRPTKSITLHSKNLKINEVSVTDNTFTIQDEGLNVTRIEYNKKYDFLIIRLKEELEVLHKYHISISFNGVLNEDFDGFYRTSYFDDETGEKRWIAVTDFEPISARRAFPCFDEPAMKSEFEISVGRTNEFKAISNFPLLDTEPIEDKEGWFWDRFERSVCMSTYHVAFAIVDFDYVIGDSSEGSKTLFRIWARKDAIPYMDFIKTIGPKILGFFEKFSIEIILPKQDVLVIPYISTKALGKWGLVVNKEEIVLYDPEDSTILEKLSITVEIAHELAHRWFGNLVTINWWDDIWLNEGFATYLEILAVDKFYPEWKFFQDETVADMMGIFDIDSLKMSHPVHFSIEAPEQIRDYFDIISFNKAGCLIHMIRHFLGDEILHIGVANYIKEHKFGNVDQDDLWRSLTEEEFEDNVLPKDVSVKTIMDTWTLQAGYPVITVKRNYEERSVEITQRRFLKDVPSNEDNDNSCWWIPLSYSTKQDLDFNNTMPKHWLSCPKGSKVLEDLVDEDDWIIFNNKMTGLYRINYDEKNWQLIIDTLNSDEYVTIPTLNRVQLISDAADLAFTGDLSYEIFYHLMQYLPKYETEYLPWKVALDKIDEIIVSIKQSHFYDILEGHMKDLLVPVFRKLKELTIQSDLDMHKIDLLKLLIIIVRKSCKFEIDECITESQKLFEEYVNSDGNNPIPVILREVVYCTSIKHGGEHEWNFIWDKFVSCNGTIEKNKLLNALCCTREDNLMEKYLEWSLDNTKVRRQDKKRIFQVMLNSKNGQRMAKKFLKKHPSTYKDVRSPKKRYLSHITNPIFEENYDNFKDLFEEDKESFSEVNTRSKRSWKSTKIEEFWQQKHSGNLHKILSH